MSATNRVRVTMIKEVTPGTTPSPNPRMRTVRLTGESLSFTPNYVDTEELRADRMLPDPAKVMQASEGAINFELSYPTAGSPLSLIYQSAFFNPWTEVPFFANDGTADSVITDVADYTDTFTVSSGGAAVKAGHLVRMSGFADDENNGIFKVASSTGTTIVLAGAPTLADDSAPAADANIRVVGFVGASGDITATASGLGSTSLNFTTLGLAVGQWIKIGGSAAGDQFATAALNGFARITVIAATALTLDNRPSGWTTDTGTSKTIKVWFGDQLKNGITPTSVTIEKGFLDQGTPTYIVNTGMQVNTLQHTVTSRRIITGVANFMGMGGGESTTSLDASPDAATTGRVIAANANVGRLAEAGSTLTDPNWSREVTFQINNNLRTVEAVDSSAPVAVNAGECTVTGRLSTYFGSDALLAKLYAGTPTALNIRVQKDSQALIWQFPRITLRSGVPAAAAKNQDVTLDADWQASIDTTTNSLVLLDRLPYYET